MTEKPRSLSLPDYVFGMGARSTLRTEALACLESVMKEAEAEGSLEDEEASSPIVKLLTILQSLLNGTDVDMSAVKWLWMRIATGDFVSGAFPTHAPRMALRGMEKDVGASLAALLGPAHTRRGSKNSDTDSVSAVNSRSRRASALSSVDVSQAADSLSDVASFVDDSTEEEPQMQLSSVPVQEIESVLQSADSWGFNAFRLAEVTEGHPLSALGFWILNTRGIVRALGLDPLRLVNFLRAVDQRYPLSSEAPYHNSTHAADVLQQIHMLLTAGGLAQAGSKREPLIQLASYLAAIVHDVDHQGVTNDFLVRTNDRLALLYNDASPQENHHLATAFQLLQQPEYNFLRGMPKERKEQPLLVQAKLRKIMISMVLATDMKMHIGLMSAFQAKVDVQKLAKTKPVAVSSRRTSAPGEKEGGSAHGVSDICVGGLFDSDTDAGRVLVLQIALKCADLGHASAPWDVHRHWIECLEEEMFAQGDREASAKMPVSPLMDRSKGGVSKSQCDFLGSVVLPLFRIWASVFPDTHPMVANAERNLDRWKAIKTAHSH